MPMIKGASTWADDQGKLTPPQVSPITHADDEEITKKFPLEVYVNSCLLHYRYSSDLHPVHALDLLEE